MLIQYNNMSRFLKKIDHDIFKIVRCDKSSHKAKSFRLISLNSFDDLTIINVQKVNIET